MTAEKHKSRQNSSKADNESIPLIEIISDQNEHESTVELPASAKENSSRKKPKNNAKTKKSNQNPSKIKRKLKASSQKYVKIFNHIKNGEFASLPKAIQKLVKHYRKKYLNKKYFFSAEGYRFLLMICIFLVCGKFAYFYRRSQSYILTAQRLRENQETGDKENQNQINGESLYLRTQDSNGVFNQGTINHWV